jgi:hypothetical protein
MASSYLSSPPSTSVTQASRVRVVIRKVYALVSTSKRHKISIWNQYITWFDFSFLLRMLLSLIFIFFSWIFNDALSTETLLIRTAGRRRKLFQGKQFWPKHSTHVTPNKAMKFSRRRINFKGQTLSLKKLVIKLFQTSTAKILITLLFLKIMFIMDFDDFFFLDHPPNSRGTSAYP